MSFVAHWHCNLRVISEDKFLFRKNNLEAFLSFKVRQFFTQIRNNMLAPRIKTCHL